MPPLKMPLGRKNGTNQGQQPVIPWIWEGAIVLGATTLLSAPEKVGKTTLLSLLLDRRRAGGELLGRAVEPGGTIVCTEESDRLWALRQPPLDFGPDVIFRSQLDVTPSRDGWRRFIDEVVEFCLEDEGSFDLMVIDTAVRFLPLSERNYSATHGALGTLRELEHVPLGTLIINQNRIVHRPLAAFADIVLEIAKPRGVGATRRRTFTGVGRYPATLESVSAELNVEGTDYVLSAESATGQGPLLPTLQKLLAESPAPLTCRELLERWPGSPPHPESLLRTLSRAVERGLVTASGKGTKTEPQRFGVGEEGVTNIVNYVNSPISESPEAFLRAAKNSVLRS